MVQIKRFLQRAKKAIIASRQRTAAKELARHLLHNPDFKDYGLADLEAKLLKDMRGA